MVVGEVRRQLPEQADGLVLAGAQVIVKAVLKIVTASFRRQVQSLGCDAGQHFDRSASEFLGTMQDLRDLCHIGAGASDRPHGENKRQITHTLPLPRKIVGFRRWRTAQRTIANADTGIGDCPILQICHCMFNLEVITHQHLDQGVGGPRLGVQLDCADSLQGASALQEHAGNVSVGANAKSYRCQGIPVFEKVDERDESRIDLPCEQGTSRPSGNPINEFRVRTYLP